MSALNNVELEAGRTRIGSTAAGSYVGQILRETMILAETVTCGAVAEHFTQDGHSPGFVIQRADQSYGLVDRVSFLPRYLERFNRDLYQRKPIAALMDADPLVVEWSTPIDHVGMMASARESIRTSFIIVRGGACVGIGMGIDLMRMVAKEAQERLAELRQAQGHLVQAQTFASLGRLVAGVAHEINTPIGVSLTAASHLRERVEELLGLYNAKSLRQSDFLGFASDANEASSIIVQNIERAADLIRSFKNVAVDQTTTEWRTFGLSDLLENTIRSLMPSLRKSRLEVHIDCDKTLQMESYPGPLTQVITNLALNAVIHGFEPGATGNFWITAAAHGDMIEITCRDDGRGIPLRNLARVFEPFFTTNRAQGGTGLGLHIVHNIVTQVLGGDVDCVSEVGHGTTFHIRIPRIVPTRGVAGDGDATSFVQDRSETIP